MEFYLVYVASSDDGCDDLSRTRLFDSLEAAMPYYEKHKDYVIDCVQLVICEFQDGMLVPIKIIAEKGYSIYFHHIGHLFDKKIPSELQ